MFGHIQYHAYICTNGLFPLCRLALQLSQLDTHETQVLFLFMGVIDVLGQGRLPFLIYSCDLGTSVPVVSLLLNVLFPTLEIRSLVSQFGSGHATSASLVIQSFVCVSLCLAANSGRTEEIEYMENP